MNDSIKEIELLLREVVEHLVAATKSDTSAAAAKLHRVAAVASTLAFTISGPRR